MNTIIEESSGLDSSEVAFEGQVVCGRGLAAPELVTLSVQVQAIVKEPLCPGSLNIVLNRPMRLLDTAGFAFDRGYRTLWPASLGGINVWVYRWRESPLHVVEILSSVYLRGRLNLKNGDAVTLRLTRRGATVGIFGQAIEIPRSPHGPAIETNNVLDKQVRITNCNELIFIC